MEKRHTFYIVYRIDKDADVDGLHLLSGYYMYTFDLSGLELERPCQFSTDRCNWSECTMFAGLGEFQDFFERVDPSPMKIEREDYVETISYKGVSVPVFYDDYGQSFYCIYGNHVVGFGGFQSDYEDQVRDMVDVCERNGKIGGVR